MRAVKEILEKNHTARVTYDQLRDRGLTEREAREEIGRAFLGVWWEHAHNLLTPMRELLGKPEVERFESVLRRLGAGETTSDIWPNET
jgi:hypothetical protein